MIEHARTQTLADEAQDDLPGMAEACRDVGLDSMPAGLANMTRRQREYVLSYLRTGNQTEAARRAGYSNPPSDGAKLQKTPVVAAFLAQACVSVAKNADALIKRHWQRSVSLHALYEQELAKPESIRNTTQLLKYSSELTKVDGLLGSLLGKIAGVNVSGVITHQGSVDHKHIEITLPQSVLPVLAQLRREAVEANRN